MDSTAENDSTVFAIFRAAEARAEDGIPIMRHEPMTELMLEGAKRMMEAGVEHGHETRLLFSAAGLSLSYVWFKSFYPLPRHSHDTDCLYYVLSGSLRLGTQEIGKGDGFFVGAGVPYAYTPGENGVEVLEFRATTSFNIKLLANNPAFWDRATQTVIERRAAWADEKPAA